MLTEVYDTIFNILRNNNYMMDFDHLSESFIYDVKKKVIHSEIAFFIYEIEEEKLYRKFSTDIASMEAKVDSYLIYFKELYLGSFKNCELLLIEKNDQSNIFFDFCVTEYNNCAVIPFFIGNKFLAMLTIKRDVEFSGNDISYLEEVTNEASKLLQTANQYEEMTKKRKKRELLLQVTKKFHSSMDVGEVLGEIIFAINEVYPNFSIYLLLSHEWEGNNQLPIKPLEYGKESSNLVATNAYLTGEVQLEDIVAEKSSIIYAPLRGKQGVYGVLQIKAPKSMIFKKEEIDFIELLADTGGNALEKAQLYQQSRQLIQDLQLINRTSHQLNSNLRLSETINFMTKQIKKSFGAEQIGFIMFRTNRELKVLEGSTEYFCNKNSLATFEAYTERIKKEKDSLFIGDISSNGYQPLGSYRSLLAVPMIQSGDLKGVVIVLHTKPFHFTFENFKLLQSLIHHSTLAFTNSILREELEKLVITDYLTRLYSRNYLDKKVQESMESDAFGCFLLIDIDSFKQINDQYGHQVGDDIIIQVANIIKRNIKVTDIAARWGGEELAIYLPKVESDTGEQVAERIVEKVAKETSPHVTISCGVSSWTQKNSNNSLKNLFNSADKGLYQAKETGKNKVIVMKME